jgi:hypothetical protein
MGVRQFRYRSFSQNTHDINMPSTDLQCYGPHQLWKWYCLSSLNIASSIEIKWWSLKVICWNVILFLLRNSVSQNCRYFEMWCKNKLSCWIKILWNENESLTNANYVLRGCKRRIDAALKCISLKTHWIDQLRNREAHHKFLGQHWIISNTVWKPSFDLNIEFTRINQFSCLGASH